MSDLTPLPEDIIHTALTKARNLLRDEYGGIIACACPHTEGKPERNRIDSGFRELAARYEHTIALVNKAIKANKATAPCGIVRMVKVPQLPVVRT